MTVEESQLVDQHRSQSETLSADQSSGGNLPVHLEDGLEMLVEVLVGHGAQLVEDASDFDAIIGVRVSSSFGSDHKPLGAFAGLMYIEPVVVEVSEQEAGSSSGNSSMRCGATSLSAVLAGVSLAQSGIQTSQTQMATCSFHP